MQLLLIRHAIAEDRARFAASGRDDGLRPLTAEGRRKMGEAARGIAGELPELDLIATSPLRRAVETAAILAEAYGGCPRIEVAALGPAGRLEEMLAWLAGENPRRAVAAVGHEPDLGRLCAWLCAGRQLPILRFKKGGACLLDLGAEPAAGNATVLWAMTPGQLRRLAETSP